MRSGSSGAHDWLHFLMPRSSVQRIIEELSWVRETPDPSKCGCRDVRCGKDNGHEAGECGHAPREAVDLSLGILLCWVPGVSVERE